MARLLSLILLAAGFFYVASSDPVSTGSADSRLKNRKHKPHQRMKGGEIFPTAEEKKRHPKHKGQSRGKTRSGGIIPKCFDAREQWPNCESIRHIRDQAQCNTCYGVAPASVISDRLCIASGQVDQTLVSAVHLISCYSGRTDKDNCDRGGCTACTYENAAEGGFITGGDHMKPVGCAPYPEYPTALSCPTTCPNTGYSPPTASADIRIDDSYWARYFDDPKNQSDIAQAASDMQTEIMTNGPISASIHMYSDFQDWTPAEGAYRPGPSATNQGGHAVRIIGWCEDSKGVPYWTVANSWGTELGDQGIYWIERGNAATSVVYAFHGPTVRKAQPAQPTQTTQPTKPTQPTQPAQTCPKSFCSAGIDHLVRLESANMASPVYAFQGECTVQVKVDSVGKLTPVGTPVPTATLFINAPSGPIVGWDVSTNRFWLQNSVAASSCPTSSSSTYTCTSYDEYGGVLVQTFLNGVKYQYFPEYPAWWLVGDGDATSVGTAITSKYTQVNTILGLSSGKILICGIKVGGGQACGTIDTTGKILSNPVAIGSSFTQC